MSFYGQSFISDPFGDCLAQAGNQEELIYAELDYTKIRELRELFQFFRDRRVDTYSPILKKVID